MKNGLRTLYGSKLGKLLPVLVIAGLVATASASVFVVYYGSATATARNNDLAIVAGTDSTSCTTNAPCIHVTPSSTGDYATIAMQLGKDTIQTPQPETYFTNASTIQNSGSASRSINSITISNIAATSVANDFGNITVYYCPTQTNAPTTPACGKFSITSTTGGPLSHLPAPVTSGAPGKGYLEIVGYFGAAATATDTITFSVQIQWA